MKASHSALRVFGFSGIVTALTIIAIGYFMGLGAVTTMLILVAVELAFSFDNAIINAKVLATMSPLWQKLFLSVGIIIAIFGMRVIFPVVIVMLSAHMPWHEVVDLALRHPHEYAEKLDLAHPAISAFGGGFLMMLALHFFTDDARDTVWIRRIERPLLRLKQWWFPATVSLPMVGVFAVLPQNHHPAQTLQAGAIGVVGYVLIDGFTRLLGRAVGEGEAHRVGWAALATFAYLEVLDASFSFDGVIGAFAITNKVILIAAGLGIGAVWVRSLTVYMVRKGTLNSYRYLEHGAHYAVFVLAATMLLSLLIRVPEVVTGVLGLGLIGASVVASRQAIAARRTAA